MSSDVVVTEEMREIEDFYARCDLVKKILSDHRPHTKAGVMDYLGLVMGIPKDEELMFKVLKAVNRHHAILKVPIYINKDTYPEVVIGYQMYDKDLLDREWEQYLKLREIFGNRTEMDLSEYLKASGCDQWNAHQSIQYFKEFNQMLADGSITINHGKVTFVKKFHKVSPESRTDE